MTNVYRFIERRSRQGDLTTGLRVARVLREAIARSRPAVKGVDGGRALAGVEPVVSGEAPEQVRDRVRHRRPRMSSPVPPSAFSTLRSLSPSSAAVDFPFPSGSAPSLAVPSSETATGAVRSA